GVAYDTAQAGPAAALALLRDTRAPERGGRGTWPALPGTLREVAHLQARGGLAVRRLDCAAASTAGLAQALPRPHLAHLATHGFFDAQRLEEDRRREKEQLRDWHFDADRPTEAVGHGARNPLAFCGLVLAGANKPTTEDPGVLTGEALLG